MNIRDRIGLKEEAGYRLSQASYNPQRLILIYAGISLGAALLVTVVNYILEMQIGETGGLSGIGMRSVFATGQSFLQLLITLLTPFWDIGIIYAAIRIARGQRAEPKDLTMGFRRFGPVLRLRLLQILLYSAVAMICMHISVIIFVATPLSGNFQQLMLPAIEEAAATGQILELDLEIMEEALIALLPLLPILLAVFLAVYYRLRLADYVLMDTEPCGALAAIFTSWRLTKGERFALFRLDLSFWWFSVLRALAMALVFSDQILLAVGSSLPIPAEVLYFVCYALYICAELALFWKFAPKIQTTYAVAYETLREQHPEAEQPPSPWSPDKN